MATAGQVAPQPTIRRIDGEYGIWQSARHATTVEYRLEVLEEIRAAVAEAFRAVPRGGLEIGGLLLGEREGNLVQITGQRPLNCEHAFGPGFVLSPRDEAGLAELLAQADSQVVGWYHSHTRSEMPLSAKDLDIQKRYFPTPWQVALVLKPRQHGPVRAALFFPGFGSADADPNEEFAVQPYRPPRPRPVPRTEARPARAAAPLATESVQALTAPARPRPEVADRAPRWQWLAITLAVVFAAAAVAARGYVQRTSEPPPPMLLRAVENNGQLEVSWDRDAKPVREAARGVLDINDGGRETNVPLDAAHVRSGSLTYARRSARVDMRLQVFGRSGHSVEEMTFFLGQPLRAAPTDKETARERDEAVQERDQALKEAESLRAALKIQMARNTQLSEAVRVLRRRRLNVQSARRRRGYAY